MDVGRWTLDVGRWTLDVGRSFWLRPTAAPGFPWPAFSRLPSTNHDTHLSPVIRVDLELDVVLNGIGDHLPQRLELPVVGMVLTTFASMSPSAAERPRAETWNSTSEYSSTSLNASVGFAISVSNATISCRRRRTAAFSCYIGK